MRASGILFDLRAAGFDVYRPDECAAVGIGRWVEHKGRAVARTMTPPPPEIEPGTYRLIPVRESSGGDARGLRMSSSNWSKRSTPTSPHRTRGPTPTVSPANSNRSTLWKCSLLLTTG